MHVKCVASAREASKLGGVHLTTIRRVNGFGVARHPLPHFREHTYRLFGNRAVRLWPDIQKIVAAVARTGNEIPHNYFRALPIVIGAVVAPAVVQRHAALPGPASLLRNDLLLRS